MALTLTRTRVSVAYAVSGLLVGAVVMGSPVRADPMPGQSAPEFVAAVDLWLTGDEATALPRLAALAQDQNAAAQIFLGLIDTTPSLQGDWVDTLPRADRIALLRAPGGLSGQNWVRHAAGTATLAQGWVALWDGDATPAVMMDIAALGEARAARIAALTLAKREKTGFAAVADDPGYPAAARAFAIREWLRHDPSRGAREAAALSPDDPQGEILGRQVDDPSGWLMTHPEGDPLVALCETRCPEAVPSDCQTAAYRAIGGYWPLMAMGSPVEAIIASDRFNRSPAGVQSVLHAMRGTDTGLACLTNAD
jgi:hypothetical protein